MRLNISFQRLALACVALGAAASISTAFAQGTTPSGHWFYDPSIHGMKDLRALRTIEGCNAPGGLTPITSSDEPGVNAPYWCGPAPFCLTPAAPGVGEKCTPIPYSTRGPRYSPTGTPGANGVRNPDDLRCDNTGLAPINSRCPVIPTAAITLNNSTNLTVATGTRVTLRVTTTNAKPEWGGTATLNCTGANAGRAPFNMSNLSGYLNVTNASPGNNTLPTAGTMTCTLTVTNWRGTSTATARVTVNNPPSGGGGGGGGGPTLPEPVLGGCPAVARANTTSPGGGAQHTFNFGGTLQVQNQCVTARIGPLSATANGAVVVVPRQVISYNTCACHAHGNARARCNNGTWQWESPSSRIIYGDACV